MPQLFLDSTGDPRVLIPAAEAALGRHVDGWIAAVGGAYPTPAAAIQWVRASGRAIAAYWEDLTPEEAAGSYQRGHLCAQAAIAAAQAMSLTSCVRLYVGIEAGWSPSAEFLTGWADGQTAGPYHGSGGVYGNPYSVAMQNALAAARAANGNAAQMPLWSAEPEPGGAPAVPEWGAATCAGATVSMWQWQEDWQTGQGATDLDLVADGADGIWEPPTPGTFSDVASARWSAADIAAAAKAGIVTGYPDGTFRPTGPLTREQGAVLAVRTLEVARGQPVTARRVYGAHPSRPVASLAHHSAWTATTASIPAEYQDPIVANWLPVEDQSQSLECVAFASTEIRHCWAEKLTGDPAKAPMLSAPYLYARAHQMSGSTTEGLTGIEAMQALKQYGVCLWASDPLPPGGEPLGGAIVNSPASLDAEAAQWRISAYGPVDPGNIAEMQQAIMHAPILVALPVPFGGGGIENPIPDGRGGYNVLWPPQAQVSGGHAVMLYGWKTDASGKVWWRLRNSWGASWAEQGNAWLDSVHPIWEAWSITCAPVNPACLALAQQVQQLQAFLADYPAIPDAHKQALQASIASAQAQQKTLGCA